MKLDVSPNARSMLRALLAEEPAGVGVRLGVLRGGCAGRRVVFSLDPARDQDGVIEVEDARLLIAPAFQAALDGARLDFMEKPRPAHFRVGGPRLAGRCPCGRSFGGGKRPARGARCVALFPMLEDL